MYLEGSIYVRSALRNELEVGGRLFPRDTDDICAYLFLSYILHSLISVVVLKFPCHFVAWQMERWHLDQGFSQPSRMDLKITPFAL